MIEFGPRWLEVRAPNQRGFTLIELMVALVVSSLLVGLVLAIFLRMSIGYRSQQQVSDVQQVLSAGRAQIEIHAKQVGLGMSTGVKILPGGVVSKVSPLRIINNNNAPDEIAFIYADTANQARIIAVGGANIQVDDNSAFAVDDLVAVVDLVTVANPIDATAPKIAQYTACILKILAKIAGNGVTVSQVAPFGNATQSHCPALPNRMMHKVIARAFRIDTSRPTEGPLQMSMTGDLFGLNDFQDIGYGFTDLQVATQFYDSDGVDSADPDTDVNRDWYSSEAQETKTHPAAGSPLEPALQITITLVARTERDVEGIASTATPALTVAGNGDNNEIGDRPSIDLTTTIDPALVGSRIYRYITFTVDLRNMGIGR